MQNTRTSDSLSSGSQPPDIGFDPGSGYVPPDPTVIENKPEALDYWARTLETTPERVGEAVRKAGPLVEDVKKELGSFGVG